MIVQRKHGKSFIAIPANHRAQRSKLLMLLGFFLLTIGWAGSPSFAALRLEKIADGLSDPVAITNAGDGSDRLFITLQGGRIMIFNGSKVLDRPFLDISRSVTVGGERGLLSVAFHPNYKANGLFFVNYTNLKGHTVIARYRASEKSNRADLSSRRVILRVQQPFSNHNGGQLQFGPDGFLYIGMGDGGSAGDPQNNAQKLGTLLGKMLRIDVNKGHPYAVPPDNPFVGRKGARPEIWALGLRNPWRFSFDRLNGGLFIGDVGQGNWEEINFERPNSPGGRNYGWRLMEGRHCFNPETGCSRQNLTLPILEYSHEQGCAVTGGYRYRGKLIPELFGTYLYADFCSGRIWGARPSAAGRWKTTLLANTGYQISAFGEDEQGELYFADLSGGTIFRIAGLKP